MAVRNQRTYSIADTSKLTGVSENTLRKWELRFPQLKPERDRSSNHRRYSEADIAIVRRIKELQEHDQYKSKGARRRLSQELHAEGAPRTNAEVLELVDKIQAEARAILDIFDRRTF